MLAPHAAFAQQPEQPPLPSYAKPSYASTEQTIHGRVTVVNGTYMEIADSNGYIDRVQLHQGTIINPTGIRLAPGMTVTIMGHNNGHLFLANEIDTPYQYDGPYAYYPYPYYPYYGPPVYFGLGIGFGGYHHWR
ncbi:MAG TPA: hypothetical protein VMD07_03230 [Candidatus Acidoferrales bacterium]|nr:hypothetical protein [Candidatus Acidoferrales bacterium]